MKFLLLILCSLTAIAGPMEDTFGVGARNRALGGAGVSIAEDYSATFYNPSLLAKCRGSRLSLEYDYIHTGLKYSEPAEQLGNYNGMNLGFCLKPLNQVGIGMYTNFSMGPIEFTPSTLTTKPDFILYSGDLKTFTMMAGIGYAPIKQFAIGAAISMATGVSLGTNLNYNPGGAPALSANFPAQISPIIGGIFGVTVTPLEDWRLGLVYRTQTYGSVLINANFQVGDTKASSTQIEGYLAYSPHQIALSSSYMLLEKWIFSGDLTYYFWSSYPGPFLQVSSTGGAIVPKFVIAGIEPPNFSNTLVPRFGVEYNVWDKIKLRAGYSYRPSPAPQPVGLSKLVDASANRISLGAGYEFQLYQNIFLTADAYFAADILANSRGSAISTGLLIGAEYD